MAGRVYKIAFKLNAMLSSKYGKAFEQAESRAERLSATFDSIGKRMSLAITAPLKGIGIASAMAAKDWESAWVGVRKVTKASEEDLQALEQTARRMARELPHTHNAIASVFEAGSRLGVATEHLEGFSRTMLAVEATTTLTLDSAANGFATIAGMMGTSQDDFDRMGSTILYLGSNFATTEAAILGMSENMAGAAALANLSEAQVMGFSTAIASIGMSAAAGGSTFSGFISDINRSVALGDENLNHLAEVAGKTADEFASAFRYDATGAILSFVSGLTRVETEGGNVLVTLDELGLTGVYMEQMLTGLVSGYDTLTHALNSANTAWDENAFLTYAVAERYATMEARSQVLRNQIRDVGITIGQVLMPNVEMLVGSISSAVEWFSNLDSGTQRTIITMGKIATAIGPVLIISGKLITTLVRLKGMYSATTMAIKAKAATTGLAINVEKAKMAATKASANAELLTSKAERARTAVIKSNIYAKNLAVKAEKAKSLGAKGSAASEALAAKAEKARLSVIRGKIYAKHLDAKAEKARAAAMKMSLAAEKASTAITTKSAISILAKSGAVKVATVAQKAWNLAMAMNPIGAVVAGTVALVAGIGFLVQRTNQARSAYRGLSEESYRVLERQQELSNSTTQQAYRFEESTRKIQNQEQHLRTLADKVSYLSEKQNLSAGEMAKLDRYISELNDSIPGLILAFDDYTGSLNLTADALQSYLAVAKAQSNLDRQLDEKLRLQTKYLTLERELAETGRQRIALYDQLNNGARRNRREREYLESSIENLVKAEGLLSNAMSSNYDTQRSLTYSIEENARAIEYFERSQREATHSVGELSNAMRQQAFASEEWEQAQNSALEKMTRSFETYKNIAGNAFKTVSEQAAISIYDMTANLLQNATAVEEWSKNMANLAERGLDEGLLEQLRQAGPEAAATVRELVNATYYELEALNTAYERSAQIAIESMARELDPSGVAESAQELIDHVALAILENEAMENALIDKVNASFNIFSNTIDYAGFDSAGYNIAYGVANGIKNGSNMVRDAGIAMINNSLASMRLAAQINSPSKKTMEMGEFLMDGLSLGVYSKENELIETCKNIVDLIQDSLHITVPNIEFSDYTPNIQTLSTSTNFTGYDSAIKTARHLAENTLNAFSHGTITIGSGFIDDIITDMYSKTDKLSKTCKNIVDLIQDSLYISVPSIEFPVYTPDIQTLSISTNFAGFDASGYDPAIKTAKHLEESTLNIFPTDAMGTCANFIEDIVSGMYSKTDSLNKICKNIVGYIQDSLHITVSDIAFSNHMPDVNSISTFTETAAYSSLRCLNKFKNLNGEADDTTIAVRPVDSMQKINATPTYNNHDIVVNYSPSISISSSGQSTSELENMVRNLLKEGYKDIQQLVNQTLDERKIRELRLSNG